MGAAQLAGGGGVISAATARTQLDLLALCRAELREKLYRAFPAETWAKWKRAGISKTTWERLELDATEIALAALLIAIDVALEDDSCPDVFESSPEIAPAVEVFLDEYLRQAVLAVAA